MTTAISWSAKQTPFGSPVRRQYWKCAMANRAVTATIAVVVHSQPTATGRRATSGVAMSIHVQDVVDEFLREERAVGFDREMRVVLDELEVEPGHARPVLLDADDQIALGLLGSFAVEREMGLRDGLRLLVQYERHVGFEHECAGSAHVVHPEASLRQRVLVGS